MRSHTIVLPILSEKIETWKKNMDDLMHKEKSHLVHFMKHHGVSRQRIWLHEDNRKAHSVVLLEGDNPEEFIKALKTSEEPFAVWFRAHFDEVHGFKHEDVSAGNPPLIDMRH